MSYWRSTTTPSMGDVMRVFSRFTRACCSAASACFTMAAAESRLVAAMSYSFCDRMSCSCRRFVRACWSSALRSSARARSRSARR
jgi:hypothetical protein